MDDKEKGFHGGNLGIFLCHEYDINLTS